MPNQTDTSTHTTLPTTAATPLYALKPTPTQFAPSLYSAEVVSVVP